MGGGDTIAQREPGAVNTRRKGVDRKVGDRAVIGQCFHQGQGNASDNGRSGKRQRDGEEGPPGPHTQRPRCFEHAAGALKEGAARQQINVGIKHTDKHQHRTRQGADIRKPVIAMCPAESFTQGRLHRPDKLEEIGINVGHDVSRHGQRQHQRPGEQASPGKVVHGGQPGGGDTEQTNTAAHTQTQPKRVEDVFRQNGVHQMRPGGAGATGKNIEANAGNRQPDEQGDDEPDNQQGRILGGAHESECEL